MITISFLNIKGGVGKSTTSFNVAAGLAKKGKRVLLVDYDPQANTTSMFLDEAPEITINDLMRHGGKTRDALTPVRDNLWLIASTLELANTEMEMRMQSLEPQQYRLKKILGQVESEFDYCIIDCAPIINLLTINAILCSDELIVPIKPDKFAIQGFSVTIDNILQIRKNFELDLEYKILFTIVNRNNAEKMIIDQLRGLVGENVYRTQIRNQPKPIVEASNQNELVIDKWSPPVAKDLRDLVDEILEGRE